MKKVIVAILSSAVLFSLLPAVSFAANLSNLNGLTTATQTFATTTNMHMLIQSSGSVHTFKWDSTVWLLNQGGTGATSFATGSIPFINNGVFSENNSQLFWDAANTLLRIGGTLNPIAKLSVKGSGSTALLNVASSSGSSYFFITSGGNSGISTSSPFAKFAIHAISGETNTILFAIASSSSSGTTTLFTVDRTASTTIANGVNITAGCFAFKGVCLTTSSSTNSILSGLQGQVAFYPSNGTTLAGTSTLFFGSSGNKIGVNTASPQSALDIVGAFYSRLVTASGTNIDWSTGNVQSLTLSSSPTLTFSGGQAGGEYTLIVKQDGTGGRTVTWPASVLWSGGTPTLTSAANAIDSSRFVFDGANYLGVSHLNYQGAINIAFDSASGTSTINGSPSSTSWNHTVSGTNTALVVFPYNDDATDKVTSVTYNGVAMTRVAVQSTASGQTVYAYLLLNPAVGAHTVSVTASVSSNQLGGVSLSYTGVKQTGQPDSFATTDTSSSGSTFSVSTTVVASGSWLVGVERNNFSVPTAGSGTTIRDTENTMTGVDSNSTVGTGSQSLQWNTDTGKIYTGIILSLSPVN